jgi:hypothetical protein
MMDKSERKVNMFLPAGSRLPSYDNEETQLPHKNLKSLGCTTASEEDL